MFEWLTLNRYLNEACASIVISYVDVFFLAKVDIKMHNKKYNRLDWLNLLKMRYPEYYVTNPYRLADTLAVHTHPADLQLIIIMIVPFAFNLYYEVIKDEVFIIGLQITNPNKSISEIGSYMVRRTTQPKYHSLLYMHTTNLVVIPYKYVKHTLIHLETEQCSLNKRMSGQHEFLHVMISVYPQLLAEPIDELKTTGFEKLALCTPRVACKYVYHPFTKPSLMSDFNLIETILGHVLNQNVLNVDTNHYCKLIRRLIRAQPDLLTRDDEMMDTNIVSILNEFKSRNKPYPKFLRKVSGIIKHGLFEYHNITLTHILSC